MHAQDKSGDSIGPFWHHEPKRQNSFEEDEAHLLDELLEEYSGLMTFDEPASAGSATASTGANRIPSKSPSAASSGPAWSAITATSWSR